MNQQGNIAVPMWAHFLCGWPLVLVLFGGAIGGAMGGLAYGVSISLFKTSLPMPLKIFLPIVIGAAAIGLWLAIGAALFSSTQART